MTGRGREGRRGKVPLLEIHDGWALIFQDGLVGMDSDVELVAQLASLDHGAGMAWMGG